MFAFSLSLALSVSLLLLLSVSLIFLVVLLSVILIFLIDMLLSFTSSGLFIFSLFNDDDTVSAGDLELLFSLIFFFSKLIHVGGGLSLSPLPDDGKSKDVSKFPVDLLKIKNIHSLSINMRTFNYYASLLCKLNHNAFKHI